MQLPAPSQAAHPSTHVLPTPHIWRVAGLQELYKDYVKTILTRVNTINGRTYSQDPAIMAWVSGWPQQLVMNPPAIYKHVPWLGSVAQAT